MKEMLTYSKVHAMRQVSNLMLLAWLASASIASSEAATLVDFEELPVNALGFFNGSQSAGPPLRNNYTTLGTALSFGATEFLQEWSSGGLAFNNNSIPAFNDSWTGWSWSNVVDTATAGVTNQYASFPGGGATSTGSVDPGGQYAVGFRSGYWNIGENVNVNSLFFTNTTYAALAARDGNDGNSIPFVSGAFGDQVGDLDPGGDDFLRVVFTGHSQNGGLGTDLGQVTRYLADYRQDKSDNPDASLFGGIDYVLDQWLEADLSTLAGSRSISFAIEGSDVTAAFPPPFDLNTPAYLAIDNISVVVIPEPSGFGILSIVAVALARTPRRRRINRSL